MCSVDWGLVAAWVGALATVGLLFVTRYAYKEWKSQFLKTRDHDVARRILNAVSDSHLVFHELRTPHALFSDAEEPVNAPIDGEPDGAYQHRRMYARYRARSRHLAYVRTERVAALFEAKALWDGNNYVVQLGELINRLAPMETSVLDEAMKYVDNLAPKPEGQDDEDVDLDVLFAPMDDVNIDDQTAGAYEVAIDNIAIHLRPKIQLE